MPDRLIQESRPCSGDDLKSVAKTAAGDLEIAELVVRAFKAAGKDGIIVVDTAVGGETALTVQEGLRFDRGYITPEFLTDQGKQQCDLVDCLVLVHELKVSNMKELLPLLEQVARDGRPLLVIADDVEGEALATLVINNARGAIRCIAVRASGSGDIRRRALLQDIAVVTGAHPVTVERGVRLDSVRLEDLGSAAKVTVTRNETTIFGGRGSQDAVQQHVNNLRAMINDAEDPYEREHLQQRLANLAGRIATIRVGGATEIDAQEQRYKAGSALHSARAAIEEGWSCGGGAALLNCATAVANIPFSTAGEQIGLAAVSTALQAPFIALAESCQKSPVALLAERQRLGRPTIGLDAENGSLEDLVAEGIIDATKVLRTVIDVAFSYARAILKTDIWSVGPPAASSDNIESEK